MQTKMVSHLFIGMHGKLLGLVQTLLDKLAAGEVAVVKVDNSNVELLILQPLQLQDRLEQVSDIE